MLVTHTKSGYKGLNLIGKILSYLQGIPVAGGIKRLLKRKGQNG